MVDGMVGGPVDEMVHGMADGMADGPVGGMIDGMLGGRAFLNDWRGARWGRLRNKCLTHCR
eukprot:8931813-Lingulodinium_polyedra.AAC.1